jgi:small conductance mechanosensitive channel
VWGVEDLAAQGIVIRLVVKTKPSEQFAVMRELRDRLQRAFDEHGIAVPPPPGTIVMPDGSPPTG